MKTILILLALSLSSCANCYYVKYERIDNESHFEADCKA
jgi:hypothetical protein